MKLSETVGGSALWRLLSHTVGRVGRRHLSRSQNTTFDSISNFVRSVPGKVPALRRWPYSPFWNEIINRSADRGSKYWQLTHTAGGVAAREPSVD